MMLNFTELEKLQKLCYKKNGIKKEKVCSTTE